MSKARRMGFDRERELARLGGGRDAAHRIMAGVEVGSPCYLAARALAEAVDNLAEALTGDRTLFHDKPSPASLYPTRS